MLLELKNIYKNYIQGTMEVPVLKDINLCVEEGEYVAIMGPSGSGKSTLMNIIGCIDKPTSGTYLLDDVEIEKCKDKELSAVRNQKIGFVFQNFNLLPRQSALDNVALPLQYAKVPIKKRKQKAKEMLEMVDLADRVNFKPTQLSGGQKQRVAIARAMVADPKILLADEPTGALDSKSGLQVMELFDTLHKQGVTIIMITHSDEIASYADRVVKIIDGELYEGDAQPVNAASAQKEQDNLTEVVQPEQAQTPVTGGDEHE
ncbi:ABC transporter ATP-binding protein [Eubacterium sp. MSJ-33]|uniref:ABC transporter ATP-binding protein n=1 Tax=Eubacterium sp. MSJ-33 TaxID=2841528 RepID=UPI00272CB540|nr:ABC transporter ATP-binding protein [Eubacterium sp. MSJ-33]